MMSHWDRLPGELQDIIVRRARCLLLKQQLQRLQRRWKVAILGHQYQQCLAITVVAEIEVTDSKIVTLVRKDQGKDQYKYETWTYVDGWLDSCMVGKFGPFKEEKTLAWRPVRDSAEDDGGEFQPPWIGQALLGVRI